MLRDGGRYRIDLTELSDSLYADINIRQKEGKPAAEVILFEGDRFGGQYGVVISLAPEVELRVRQLLARHGLSGDSIAFFTDRNAYPGTLPSLPAGPPAKPRPHPKL